jgi:hypothetical protein
MAITRGEGKLYCWGEGMNGATGLGGTGDVTTPTPVVGALEDARVVRIAAGAEHSCALVHDGRVFAFGFNVGIPAVGLNGIPQLLQEGALAAGTTVSALSTGCFATHAAFIAGPPPTEPGDGWLFEKIRQLKSQLRKQIVQYRTWTIALRDRSALAEPLLTIYSFAAVQQLVQKINDMQTAYNMIPDDYTNLNQEQMAAGLVPNPAALACTQPLKF